ncbi:MAG TPA: hypothetical protein PK198_10700, partial [Saprospiraceae bacterium]|nr:hypothetical protein [Saprospiraceae bacterium]
MEEIDLKEWQWLLRKFCESRKLSRMEEIYISEKLKTLTNIQTNTVDPNGYAYEGLVEVICTHIPNARDKDVLNGKRINELYHRSKNKDLGDGLKGWYRPELFNYLYQFIAISENKEGIRTRRDYLEQAPEIILENYTEEELTDILKDKTGKNNGTEDEQTTAEKRAKTEAEDKAKAFLRLLQLKMQQNAQMPAPEPPAVEVSLISKKPDAPLEALQALRHRLRQLGLLAVVFGLSTILLGALYFSERKSHQTQGIPHINYAAFKGDSIGQFNLQFRLKDTLDGLWEYPTLTFYKLKNDPKNNDWFIVEMEGLYRSNDGGSGPNTTRHIGIARKHDSFIQFELEPIDAKEMNDYGKWYATIYHAGASFPDVLPGK